MRTSCPRRDDVHWISWWKDDTPVDSRVWLRCFYFDDSVVRCRWVWLAFGLFLSMWRHHSSLSHVCKNHSKTYLTCSNHRGFFWAFSNIELGSGTFSRWVCCHWVLPEDYILTCALVFFLQQAPPFTSLPHFLFHSQSAVLFSLAGTMFLPL